MKFSLVTLVALFSSAVVHALPASNSNGGIAVLLEAEAHSKRDVFDAAPAPNAKLERRAVRVNTGPTLQKQMLDYHNAYRAHHATPPVTWSPTLAAFAAQQAGQCRFSHTLNNPYGENVGGTTYSNAAYLIYLMYIEINSYNYNNPGFSKATGHFTQLVWASTTQIGCAWATGCPGNLPNILFCEYSPRGNVLPAANFAANVKYPVSRPKLPPVPPMNG
ncbi:hypothetical protein TWF696_007442 [Orbilia brochopaga]|uniref:SCP domain-containing protein n=1 Tax=Orbilia brochopaga TaxID=3140254 RepID=A0AAV9UNL6_9PEZI